MTKPLLSEKLKNALSKYLAANRSAELVNTYLCFIENKFNVQPVLFPKDKVVYLNEDEAVKAVEEEGKLWNETEIKIAFGDEGVNELTERIYICPFSGKVFGDNTHPNPQDAIYDWVSKCKENTERVGGLRVKRFFVSEDPEVIKSYIQKNPPKAPIVKKAYSSALNGKLFSSKKAVIKDFVENYLKPMTLIEVQSQNKFKIDEDLLNFIQDQLQEDKVAGFIQSLAEYEEFQPYIAKWLG